MMITLIACGNKAPLNDSSESSTSESSIATNTNTSSTDEISDTVSQISSVETAETIETTDTTETADLTELVSFAESDLPVFSDDPDINHRYYEAILTLETTGILPDGTYCYAPDDSKDYKNQRPNVDDNYIAVYDVNEDMQNELLIRIGGTNNSNSADYVFSYNKNGSFELLFDYYLGLEFYSHGIIYAKVSHSTYIPGEGFWPYEIYSYDNEQKQYFEIATVHQIDLNYNPEAEDRFPHEYDIDNDGVLYKVIHNNNTMYKDFDDYTSWRNSILPGEKIDILWFKL